jgi:hypothetical protein
MTIHTGASVTTAGPDIVAGLPKRKPCLLYALQMASRRTSLSWRPWWSWLRDGVHYEFGCLLQRSQTNHPGTGHSASPWSSSGFEVQRAVTGWRKGVVMVSWSPTKILLPDQSWCDRMVTAWLEDPIEVGDCTVAPSLKSYYHEGLYIARTLVQA